MSRRFARFIGVDWSGDKHDRGGVYAAEVRVGRRSERPRVERVVRSSRAEVEAELRALRGPRTLVGLDFSFSFPAGFVVDGRDDWSWDDLRRWAQHLVDSSGGDVRAALHAAPERAQFRLVAGDRAALLWRETERACHPLPASVQDLVVYQRQVTLGTLHGIAVLERLRDAEHVAVWPFDADRVDSAPVVVAEVYPAMWLDFGLRKSRFGDRLRQVEGWQEFADGLDGAVAETVLGSGDALDALAVALALPTLALEPPEGPDVAREGWILGVPVPSPDMSDTKPAELAPDMTDRPKDPNCDLCEAARITPWHHDDDVCWIAECELCSVPMVVWRSHGTEPPSEELGYMHEQLGRVALAEIGEFYVDDNMRNIPDHYHAHARPKGGFFGHHIVRPDDSPTRTP